MGKNERGHNPKNVDELHVNKDDSLAKRIHYTNGYRYIILFNAFGE